MYNISVKATNSAGDSFLSYYNQTVDPALALNVTSTPNPSDKGEDITFRASPSGGSGTYSSYSYVLYNGTSTSDGELTSGTAPSFTYNINSTGTYLVDYSVTDTNNNTVLKSYNQTVNPDPSVYIQSSQDPTDAGLLVKFQPVISGGTTPISFNWSADGHIYTSRDINVSFASQGNYTISLLITDANGYTASATLTETVLAPQNVEAYANLTEVDTGISVKFTSIAINGTAPFNYTWTDKGAILAYTENYTSTFSTPGTVTLEITVRDSLGANRTANVTITVNPNPTVSISVNHITTDAGIGITATSTISGGTGPYTSSWYSNNIKVSSNSSFIFNTSTPGSYNLSVIITDKFGRIADSNVIDEIVAPDPVISVTYSSPPIVSESTTIYSHITGGVGNYTLDWTFSSGTISGRNVTYSFATAGNRTFSIYITDSSGYSNTQHFVVFVALRVEISETSKSGPAPLTETFQGAALGGTSYLWSWNFGNGATSVSQSPTQTFAPGNYTVTLTVTDSAGVSTTASVYIQSLPPPVSFSYTNNRNITQVFHFYAIPNWDVKAPFNVSWTMPDGQVLYGMNISYKFPVYSATNLISVVFNYSSTSVYGGSSYSSTISISMVPAIPSINFTPPAEIATGTLLVLNATVTDPDSSTFTYVFDVNGTDYPGNGGQVMFNNAGVYSVKLTVTDSLGASATVARNITVLKPGHSSTITITVSKSTSGPYIYYSVHVQSLVAVSYAEAYIRSNMVSMPMVSGNSTDGYYNVTVNQQDYSAGLYGLKIVVFNANGDSNSATESFSVSSQYAKSSFSIVAFFGGIDNLIITILTIAGIVVTYAYARPKATDINIGNTTLVARPGKPVTMKNKKRVKK